MFLQFLAVRFSWGGGVRRGVGQAPEKSHQRFPDRFYEPGVSGSFSSKKYMVEVGGSKNFEQIHPQPS